MRTRLLLLSSLVSSAIACTAAPDTVQLHPHINNTLQPGESGTLLELNDDRHWIEAIVLSENYLFIAVQWAGVFRMPKYGGDVVALDEDPGAAFYHLATDGARVYWIHVTFDDRDYPLTVVKSQPVDGGPTTTIAQGAFGISSSSQSARFQVAGGYVYWSADTGGGTPGLTERVPVGGGPRETMLSSEDITKVPDWLADDAGLYLADSVIQLIATPGQTPEVIATNPALGAIPVGRDANAIYLESPAGVWSLSKAGRSVSKIGVVSDDGFPGSAVAFDESNIYGVDSWRDPTTLVRFPKTGGVPTPLADVTGCLVYGGGQPFIAVDAQYVFLVCGDQNRIDVAPNPAAP